MAASAGELQALIAELKARRAQLGDAAVAAALAALEPELAQLQAAGASTVELAVAAPRQVLRLVSIVFLDVAGSTALSRRLDPEDIQAVMDGLLRRGTAIVEQQGGRVLQYAGDNLLAAFGADGVAEDDAERAVRAALALVADGAAEGARVEREHGHAGLAVRVGVHTGEVLLGGGVNDEGTIRGTAVNVAARMEQTAPPGAVRISQDTWHLVRGLFELQAQPPIDVKGVAEPLATYLVLRERPAVEREPERGIDGVPTRLVGREAELEELRAVFAALGPRGPQRTLAVLAEAGVGKSRLLHEFLAELGSQPGAPRVLRARCHPQSPGMPFGLLRQLLLRHAGLDDAVDGKTLLARWTGVFAPSLAGEGDAGTAEAQAQVLGQLAGLDFAASPHVAALGGDAGQLRARGLHAARRWLAALAAQGPLLIVLEDLHWADEASLDFVASLRSAPAAQPLLLLALARPEIAERRADWAPGAAGLACVPLRPLDSAASTALASELLKRMPAPPAELVALLVQRAEGNPFFMEELVMMLIDQGAIDTAGSHWSYRPGRVPAASLPATLTGVLQARLDRLQAEDRQALQQSAVIGPVFWDDALAQLEPRAPERLPALQRRELVQRRPGAASDGAAEFGFRHHLLHQVTYGTLLKRDRRAWHARVATWMTGLKGPRGDELLAATAEHFERAGDAANACEYYVRAAERAASRAALQTVARLLEPAARLLPPGQPMLHWRLLVQRATVHELSGRAAEQAADLATLQALAAQIDTPEVRVHTLIRVATAQLHQGDYAAEEATMRECLRHAEAGGAPDLRLKAQILLANALGHQGRVDEAEALARSALAGARALGLVRGTTNCLMNLAVIAGRRGDYLEAWRLSCEALALAQSISHLIDEAICHLNIGACLLRFGQPARAREHTRSALRQARGVGFARGAASAMGVLAGIELAESRPQAALAEAEAGVAAARAARHRGAEAQCEGRRGHALAALGQPEEARRAWQAAHDLLAAAQDRDARLWAAQLAEHDAARGESAAAAVLLDEALAAGPGGQDFGGTDRLELLWSAHRAAASLGDARAPALLQAAGDTLREVSAALREARLDDDFAAHTPLNRAISAALARGSC